MLKSKEDINLPPYKGSTLRGGFGNVFRRICCVNKKVKICSECSLRDKCAYAYIFETSPSKDAEYLKNLNQIPRPFVIEPPLEKKSTYRKDEFLEFSLILIGKAIDYLSYFIYSFKELGNLGIGRGQGRFELSRVYNFKRDKIYDSENEILKKDDTRIDFKKNIESLPLNSNCLSLNFLTPTRIKFKDDLVVKPEFHIILRALLHRLSALSYFHCDYELKIDYNSLISKAEEIKIKESEIRWLDWERYSSKQNIRMKLGGFMGYVSYEGDFKEFLPLLLLGEYTHIGKNCTFGLGKYEILRRENGKTTKD